MSNKQIYYRTRSYDTESGDRATRSGNKGAGENPNARYNVESKLSPLPSTGTYGSWKGSTSAAASCKEALQKLEFIQKRDKLKGFPQTFKHYKVSGNHCYGESNSELDIEIPVEYVPEAMTPAAMTPAMTPDTNSMGGYTRRQKQRRVSTRRRRASRRKVKRTRHSTKRRR